MIWVSWRQHRGQAIACLCLLAALAAYAIGLSTSMRSAFGQDGLNTCLAHGGATTCPGAVQEFMGRFGSGVNIAFWAVLLLGPGLIGVVIGAQLLGREIEAGTWRLAWSQSVPWSRWLIAKMALVTGGLVVLGAAMTAVIMWYRAPMDRLTGRFIANAYDYEGVVLTCYILFAFGLAVLAGTILRRSVTAMVSALVVWLGVRLAIEQLLRPHFQTPVALHQVCGTSCHGDIGVGAVPPQTGRIGDWVLKLNGVNRGWLIQYQPADRFWHFQFIEGGIFLVLTALTLAVTVWLVHRRSV